MDALLEFLMKIPSWLEAFDRLMIPAWALFLGAVVIGFALVLATREFFGWYFKTHSILDELQRLESQSHEFEADIKMLTAAVRRLESTAAPKSVTSSADLSGLELAGVDFMPPTPVPSTQATRVASEAKKPQFPI